MRHLRLIFPLILAVFTLAFFSTCQKDDDSENEADPWSLVLEETIGPSGGTLSDETFSLEIPAGVFNTSTTLSLYSSSTKVFGDNQASPSYELNGLPEEFEGTLPIRIKTSRQVLDEFFLVAGTINTFRSSNDTAYAMRYLSAVDSAGYIISSIVAVMSGRGSQPAQEFRGFYKGKMYISTVDHQGTYPSKDGKFLVTFSKPEVSLADATTLGEGLADAVNKFGEQKFDTAQLRSSYPIPVTFRPFKNYLWGYVGDNVKLYGVYSTPLIFSPSFQFNSLKFETTEEKLLIAPNAGHECFHMIQSLYKTNETLENWLTEATATYTEEWFSVGDNYIPKVFTEHWYRPLTGMQDGATFYDPSENITSSAFHGYGMSAIIKYFIENAKVPFPLKVMIESIDNNIHPVDAVFSVVPGEDLSATWELAMQHYVSKTTYPMDGLQRAFIAGDLYYGLAWAKFVTLRADETVFPSVTYDLPDLSATFVNITLEGNFSPEQEIDINITTSGDIGHILFKRYYYIFKENGAETPFLEVPATGTEKLQSLKENNYRIAVLLTNSRHVNPYTEKTQVTAEIRIYGSPNVQTNEATDVSSSSATLNALINPSGPATTGYFEYGLTEAYGNTIPLNQSAMSGFQPVEVTANLTGLQANKTYHYRIVATNSMGRTEGLNLTFETGTSGNIEIGANYQGGIIFYLEPGGLHGLIAAPEDLANAVFGCYGHYIVAASSVEIGTGMANTIMLVDSCGGTTAAGKCLDLELNGYNDWFLPSFNELFEIYKNKDALGGFPGGVYWSSSDGTTDVAWAFNFVQGNNMYAVKTSSLGVRPVRKF
jgi:hypothetical protein